MLKLKYARINGATVVTKEFQKLIPNIDEYPPAEAVIEYASRLCYNSTNKFGTNNVFLKGLIKAGHMDVFEHAALSIVIEYRELDDEIIFSPHEDAFDMLQVMPYLRFDISSDYDLITVCGNIRSLLEMVEMKTLNQLHGLLQLVFDSALAIVAPNIHTSYVEPSTKPSWLEATLRDEYERIILAELDERDTFLLIDNITETGAVVTPIGYMGGRSVLNRNYHATYLLNGISRAMSHQLVRHRLLSFSQMSQRYVDYAKQGDGFVYPTGMTLNELTTMHRHFDDVKEYYNELRDSMKKEDARAILPNAAITHLVFSTFNVGMKHFLRLRTASDAQEEIRLVALKVEEFEKERHKWDI